MAFESLVTSGWIFDISLCKNLISKSINHDVFFVFSSHSFLISSPLDVPAGVTRDFSSTFLLRSCLNFSREKELAIPFLKKNQNAPRPSEHPPVMGEKCQNV